jgi:heterodisulfide reductase subunit C2
MTFAMDLLPDEVIRLSLLGQDATVLGCRTIWVCSSCETCTTRCPNAIDIAGVMDWLKEESLRRGFASPQPQVAKFHQTFLDTIRLTGGRLSEPVLLGLYSLKSGGLVAKIKSGTIRDELRLAWELARRGRLLPKLPPRLQGRAEIKKIFAESKRRASK